MYLALKDIENIIFYITKKKKLKDHYFIFDFIHAQLAHRNHKTFKHWQHCYFKYYIDRI